MDWDTVISISKEFRFDAAHFLPAAPKGHPNSRMHGHSFAAVLTLEGDADAAHGWVRDFAEIEGALSVTRPLGQLPCLWGEFVQVARNAHGLGTVQLSQPGCSGITVLNGREGGRGVQNG